MFNTRNVLKNCGIKISKDRWKKNEEQEEEYLGKRYTCNICTRNPESKGLTAPLNAFRKGKTMTGKSNYMCGKHYMQETHGNTDRIGKDD